MRFRAQPHKIKNVRSLDNYLRNHFDRRYEREYSVARTMSDAMDWLETNYNHERFFLYVDMWDPHEPFDCPWYDYELYADPGYDGDQLTYPQYGRSTYMTEAEHQNVPRPLCRPGHAGRPLGGRASWIWRSGWVCSRTR